VPHIVTGGGFVTRMTIVDLGPATNRVTVNYIGQSGTLAGQTAQPLASGGTLQIEAPGSPSTVETQWAVVGADAPVSVYVMVEQKSSAEEVRPASSFGFTECVPADAFAIPAEFEPAPAGHAIGRTLGLAIANPSPAAVDAELRLVDPSGAAVANHALSLPPFGQIAIDLQQLDAFRAALPASHFVGSVTGAASSPLCVLALFDNYGPFLVAPVGRKPK
jgi:hypothetical protein